MHEQYIIAWDIEPTPRVKVGPWPDRSGWSNEYLSTSGWPYEAFQQMDRNEQAQALLNLAADLMFEGIDRVQILREFSRIDVWREMSVLLPSGRWQLALTENPLKPGEYQWNPHNPG